MKTSFVAWGAIAATIALPILTPQALTSQALAAPGAAPAAGAAPATTAAATTAGPAGAAAQVNNDYIQKADVERQLSALKDRVPELKDDSPQSRQTVQNWRDTVLDNLITNRLLFQEAQKRKLLPTSAQVDDKMKQIKAQYKNDADFQASLTKEGTNVEHVREFVTEQLALSALDKKLTIDIVVNDDDLAKFYQGHLDMFQLPERVRARHILVAVKPDATAADKAKAKAKAMDILKQAKSKKADFYKLAAQYSDDPGSKEQGGDLGFFARGEMVPAFETAAFATAAGQITGPVESEFGYHIIKVEEKSPAHPVPLQDIKADPDMTARLKTVVLNTKAKERWDQLLASLKAQATIKKFS